MNCRVGLCRAYGTGRASWVALRWAYAFDDGGADWVGVAWAQWDVAGWRYCFGRDDVRPGPSVESVCDGLELGRGHWLGCDCLDVGCRGLGDGQGVGDRSSVVDVRRC